MDEDSSTEQKSWQVSKRKDMRSECQVKASDVFVMWPFGPHVISFTKDSRRFVTPLTQVVNWCQWCSCYKLLLGASSNERVLAKKQLTHFCLSNRGWVTSPGPSFCWLLVDWQGLCKRNTGRVPVYPHISIKSGKKMWSTKQLLSHSFSMFILQSVKKRKKCPPLQIKTEQGFPKNKGEQSLLNFSHTASPNNDCYCCSEHVASQCRSKLNKSGFSTVCQALFSWLRFAL